MSKVWCTSPNSAASNLPDEAHRNCGRADGIRYAIGTRVRVQVSRVDPDGRKIDLQLVLI